MYYYYYYQNTIFVDLINIKYDITFINVTQYKLMTDVLLISE